MQPHHERRSPKQGTELREPPPETPATVRLFFSGRSALLCKFGEYHSLVHRLDQQAEGEDGDAAKDSERRRRRIAVDRKLRRGQKRQQPLEQRYDSHRVPELRDSYRC